MVGLLFVVAVLLMYRMWGAQMRETPKTRSSGARSPTTFETKTKRCPRPVASTPGQKLLFWGFFWCGILLLLCGLVLWFPHWIPWNLRYLRYFAVIVHPARR